MEGARDKATEPRHPSSTCNVLAQEEANMAAQMAPYFLMKYLWSTDATDLILLFFPPVFGEEVGVYFNQFCFPS